MPTRLFTAVKSKDVARVRAALECRTMNVDALDWSSGQTALMRAVQQQSVDIVRVLCEAGASPNVPLPRLATSPLWTAVPSGYSADERSVGKALVEILLAAGADPSFRRPGPDSDSSVLHYACAMRHWDIVKLLIEAGADVTYQRSRFAGGLDDTSVLMMAAGGGRADIVSSMLERGADPTIRQTYWLRLPCNQTALHWACASQYHNPDVVRLLINAGADVNVVADRRMTSNRTALRSVLKSFSLTLDIRFTTQSLDALAIAGADPFVVDTDGRSFFEALGSNPVLLDSRPSRL